MTTRAELEARVVRSLANLAIDENSEDPAEESAGHRREARWMVDAVLDATRPTTTEWQLDVMVERRLSGEPLQYVLGAWAFRSLTMTVDARALIPRPETEQVVETALGELKLLDEDRSDPVVVDLGTGTGAIALSIASEAISSRPRMRVIGSDVDPEALNLAKSNLSRIAEAPSVPMGSVEFLCGDWFEALPTALLGKIDLVISNPPYVAESEWEGLSTEVRHEPRRALVAGDASDGTPGAAAIEFLVAASVPWLRRPGVLILELAPHQADAAKRMAQHAGFSAIRISQDLSGRDRTLVARRA